MNSLEVLQLLSDPANQQAFAAGVKAMQDLSIAQGQVAKLTSDIALLKAHVTELEARPIVTANAHQVQLGDTLFTLSQKYGIPVVDLQTWNKMTNTVILVGQFIRLTAPTPTPTPTPTPSSRFPGDPGTGKVLTGGTVYSGTAGVPDGRAWLDQQTGVKHLLTRRYNTGSFWVRSQIAGDAVKGLVPFPSMKIGGFTAAQIRAGAADQAITAEAKWAAAQAFAIHTSYYHEMEDNFPSDSEAADFRGAFRRIVKIFRDNAADNVSWQPIFMAPYAFQSGGGESRRGPWFKWDPDWKGTKSGSNGRTTSADFHAGPDAVCDLLGFDQYSPHAGGGTQYVEFAADMNATLDRIKSDGRPMVPWMVPEFGTEADTPPGLPADGWTGYYQRAFRYMRDHGGVGFVTYNTDGNNFVKADGAVKRLAGYKAALASEAAYLVIARPAL